MSDRYDGPPVPRPAAPLDRARRLPGGIGPDDPTDAELDATFDALLAKLAVELDVDNRDENGRRRA